MENKKDTNDLKQDKKETTNNIKSQLRPFPLRPFPYPCYFNENVKSNIKTEEITIKINVPEGNYCENCSGVFKESFETVDMFGNKSGNIRTNYICKYFNENLYTETNIDCCYPKFKKAFACSYKLQNLKSPKITEDMTLMDAVLVNTLIAILDKKNKQKLQNNTEVNNEKIK